MSQFMYLRTNGTKKNPGKHPVGILAVQKHGDDAVKVSIATIHSEDRFEKSVGKEIVTDKLGAGICVILNCNEKPNLHAILPKGFAKRLNSYVRHQEIFELLVKDEAEDGTWSKQNSDLIQHEDQRIKLEKSVIEKCISIRDKIRSEHGCAP